MAAYYSMTEKITSATSERNTPWQWNEQVPSVNQHHDPSYQLYKCITYTLNFMYRKSTVFRSLQNQKF